MRSPSMSNDYKLTIWTQEIDENNIKRMNLAPLSVDIQKVYNWEWREFRTHLLKAREGTLENGRELPDLIELGSSWIIDLIRDDLLLNITDLANELYATDTFFPRALSSCRDYFDIDHFYALPFLLDVRLLFYNEALLGDYLSSHPESFKSWEEFEAMCTTLRAKLGDRVIGIPHGGAHAFHDILPWVWAAGGDFISPSRQVLIDDERTQRAVRRLAHLTLEGCSPLPGTDLTASISAVRNQFDLGRLGMMTGGYWMTHAEKTNFKAVIHPPDLFRATFIGGSNLAIVKKHGESENSHKYELAKHFLRAMLETKNQVRFAQLVGKIPSNISAWKQFKLHHPAYQEACTYSGNKPVPVDILEVFDDALSYTIERGMPPLPNFSEIEERLKECMVKIWSEVGNKGRNEYLSLDDKKNECDGMIKQQLETVQNEIGYLLTGYSVKYTREQVEGRTPPSKYDLWLDEVNQEAYVKGIDDSITGVLFKLLLSYAKAPRRQRSRDDILRDKNIWDTGAINERSSERRRNAAANRLSQEHGRLRNSLGTINNTLIIPNRRGFYGIDPSISICLVSDAA